MSLQVKVRKDIFRYEERFYLGLTLRKALCTYPTIIVVGAILAANYWILHIDKDLLQYIILFIALPPLAIGWIKIKDMPIEKYLMYFYRYHYQSQERFYRNEWTEVKPVAKKRKQTKNQTEVEVFE